MKKYLLFSMFLFLIIFIGCEKSVEPIEIKDGRINGKITIGNYNKTPKSILWIKLYQNSNNQMQFIDSVFTEHARYIFDNLEDGVYSICFTQDYNYTPFRNWQPNDAVCKTYEVNNSSKIDSLDFHLFAWHHYTQDSILIEVDTTSWISSSVSTLFYNDGVRDTINWHINPSSMPAWLYISPTNGSYEPESQSDKRLSVTINRTTFPNTMWGHSVQLEIFSQFAVHLLTVVFNVV